MMHDLRRRLLGAGALAAAGAMLGRGAIAAGPEAVPASPGPARASEAHSARPAADATLAPDVVPPIPSAPPPGRPGEFDFLTGEWRIRHRSLVGREWLEYEGEATVHRILDGIGSVEELRIPARKFSGMGLRLLDVEKRVWSDHWVNARSGVLTTPGQTGGFVDGVGIFSSTEEDNGKITIAAGLWDAITPRSCRWRQVLSEDGGRTWAHTWIMRWTRVGG